MKRFRLFLIGLFAACLPMLMAPSGGFPYRPTFGAVAITNTGPASFGQLSLNATSLTVPNFVTFNTTGVFKGALLNERVAGGNCTGDSVDDMCLRSASGRLYGLDTSGAGQIAIGNDSGAITWSFATGTSSCTVTGTNASVSLHRIGKVVTGVATSTGTCTIASGTQVSTSNAPVPVAFRPAAAVACGATVVTNGSGVAGSICVSSAGNFTAQLLTGTTTTLGIAATSFTYTLD